MITHGQDVVARRRGAARCVMRHVDVADSDLFQDAKSSKMLLPHRFY